MSAEKFIAGAGIAAAILFAAPATAAVISVSGAGLLIATPDSVDDDTPSSTTAIQIFDVVQRYKLTSDLLTDQGTVAAGTKICSHLVFFNQSESDGARVRLKAQFGFDGDILGTMSDRDGALRIAPSDYLGGSTSYTNFAWRGLEPTDKMSFTGSTLDVVFGVINRGDWVRVVTMAAVPVPAGGLLLPLALGGLAMVRRRRRNV
jgi:hypothetical protein